MKGIVAECCRDDGMNDKWQLVNGWISLSSSSLLVFSLFPCLFSVSFWRSDTCSTAAVAASLPTPWCLSSLFSRALFYSFSSTSFLSRMGCFEPFLARFGELWREFEDVRAWGRSLTSGFLNEERTALLFLGEFLFRLKIFLCVERKKLRAILLCEGLASDIKLFAAKIYEFWRWRADMTVIRSTKRRKWIRSL